MATPRFRYRERFDASRTPWPEGVRKTKRPCDCTTCKGKKPHAPYEVEILGGEQKGHLIYLQDGQYIEFYDTGFVFVTEGGF